MDFFIELELEFEDFEADFFTDEVSMLQDPPWDSTMILSLSRAHARLCHFCEIGNESFQSSWDSRKSRAFRFPPDFILANKENSILVLIQLQFL